jgi:hypothetical protein
MLRNKGADSILLKWNGIEVNLAVGQTLDVKVFGPKDDKETNFLEERFIAKYSDSIERMVKGMVKPPEAKVATGPGPDALKPKRKGKRGK